MLKMHLDVLYVQKLFKVSNVGLKTRTHTLSDLENVTIILNATDYFSVTHFPPSLFKCFNFLCILTEE